MHLNHVGRGFLGTSGIVGQGIPHAGRARRGSLRYVAKARSCCRSSVTARPAGAFDETLNIVSLWKVPVVFVMERNNDQAYTKVEQEERERGRPTARGEGQGRQHAGRDRRRR